MTAEVATLARTVAHVLPTADAAHAAAKLCDRGMYSPAMALMHALESGDVDPLLDIDAATVESTAQMLLDARGWRTDDVRALAEIVAEHALQTGDERTVVEGPALVDYARPWGCRS